MVSRRIGRGILAILVAMVVGIRARDINKKEHAKICEALVQTITLWKMVESKEWIPSMGLASALRVAIFGDERVGLVGDLKETLPEAYVIPGHRGQWCASCNHNEEKHPGKSIPHDIMCLCSTGRCEEPFQYHGWSGCKGYWTEHTLCGKTHEELGHPDGGGWWSKGGPETTQRSTGNLTKYLQISWNQTVWGCMKAAIQNNAPPKENIQMQLAKLNQTLEDFEKLLKGKNQKNTYGGSSDSTSDHASDQYTFYVHYGSCGDASHGGEAKKPWWKRLLEALKRNTNASREEEEAFFNSASTGSTAGYYGGSYQHTQGHPAQDGGPPQAVERSSTTQGNGSHTHGSINNTMGGHEEGNHTGSRFQYLRSSTTITRPLCLLSTSFLI
ncbi:Variant surface glycoprotein [Trypanosoma congolense IL3000]|uniref:Variant surface glycoprotein n=1 Tax=Trypanosoma congolense (strain IL3000) TaxID=1068625 RepID=F9W7B5_TRYCI|nr:Variant surface glycoprotein [Trypanosoma congolense IL3000]